MWGNLEVFPCVGLFGKNNDFEVGIGMKSEDLEEETVEELFDGGLVADNGIDVTFGEVVGDGGVGDS